MKRTETIFVLLVFGLIFVVATNPASFTGYAVDTPAVSLLASDGYSTYTIPYELIMEGTSLSAEEGSFFTIERDTNRYSIQISKVSEDYEKGIFYTILSVNPGQKHVMLLPGKEAELDLDNDGAPDCRLKLEKMAYGSLYFYIYY